MRRYALPLTMVAWLMTSIVALGFGFGLLHMMRENAELTAQNNIPHFKEYDDDEPTIYEMDVRPEGNTFGNTIINFDPATDSIVGYSQTSYLFPTGDGGMLVDATGNITPEPDGRFDVKIDFEQNGLRVYSQTVTLIVYRSGEFMDKTTRVFLFIYP